MKPDNLITGQICERCQQPFICNPTNISQCNCSKITLTFDETHYITQQFSNCVCNACLLQLKNEFLNIK